MKQESKKIIYEFDSVERETEKAILLVKGTKKNWIPKSQITNREPNSIELPSWLVTKLK